MFSYQICGTRAAFRASAVAAVALDIYSVVANHALALGSNLGMSCDVGAANAATLTLSINRDTPSTSFRMKVSDGTGNLGIKYPMRRLSPITKQPEFARV